MNVIEFFKYINPENPEKFEYVDKFDENFFEMAFIKIAKVGEILSEYEKKHELKHSCFGESYFQSDDIMIEGSQEVFPKIMNLLLSEIDDESK